MSDRPREDSPDGWATRRLVLVVVVLAALAATWRWTPLGDAITAENLAAAVRSLRESPFGPLIAFAVIGAGGCLMLPVTVLIFACGLAFGPLVGFATALAGALASAAAGYGLGRLLWRDAIRRLAGRRLNRLSHALAERGVASITLVRLVPVAPFAVVNLVAGASHVRLRDYLIGSLLGLAPGTLALTFFASSAEQAIREPSWSTVLTALGIAAALAWGFQRLRRHLAGGRTPASPSSAPPAA